MIDHQWEMAYAESNGHVTPKSQGHDQKNFDAPYLRNGAR